MSDIEDEALRRQGRLRRLKALEELARSAPDTHEGISAAKKARELRALIEQETGGRAPAGGLEVVSRLLRRGMKLATRLETSGSVARTMAKVDAVVTGAEEVRREVKLTLQELAELADRDDEEDL